jgi:hypothetical protein
MKARAILKTFRQKMAIFKRIVVITFFVVPFRVKIAKLQFFKINKYIQSAFVVHNREWRFKTFNP